MSLYFSHLSIYLISLYLFVSIYVSIYLSIYAGLDPPSPEPEAGGLHEDQERRLIQDTQCGPGHSTSLQVNYLSIIYLAICIVYISTIYLSIHLSIYQSINQKNLSIYLKFRVMDLKVEVEAEDLVFSWTSPGEDFDWGKPTSYQLFKVYIPPSYQLSKVYKPTS